MDDLVPRTTYGTKHIFMRLDKQDAEVMSSSLVIHDYNQKMIRRALNEQLDTNARSTVHDSESTLEFGNHSFAECVKTSLPYRRHE